MENTSTKKILTKSERHALQKAAVLPYASMDDLPSTVLDHLAKLNKSLPLVFVLYYGGTIGMTETQGYFEKRVYGPANDAEKLLEPLTMKGLEKKVQVVWIPVYKKAIDSTNGRWVHWVSIGNVIKLLYDMATGFVICGGTDTMAFLTAAQYFMFPNIGKPIVATGSQVPMIELGDDATNNLYFAIMAAASDLSGTFLVFGDELMDGAHVHKIQDKRRKAFTCPQEFFVGHFDSELRIYSHAARRVPYINSARLTYRPHFREGVKPVLISPAMPSESLLYDAHDPNCSVVLLITFGAGNVRDEGIIEAELTHIDCLWQLFKEGIPIVLGSPMMDGVVDSPYLSGARAVSRKEGDGNAISGGNVTGALLQIKCMVMLERAWDRATESVDYDKFRNLMEVDGGNDLI